MIDLLAQLVATAMLLYGLWLMGNRNLYGPLLCALSELLWIAIFVPHAMWGGVLMSLVLCVMQVRNFIKWMREPVKSELADAIANIVPTDTPFFSALAKVRKGGGY